MNHYPLWKNLLILSVILAGLVLALPNLFDQNPSIEVGARKDAPVDAALADKVGALLKAAELPVSGQHLENGRLLVRFADSEIQLKAQDVLKKGLGEDYTEALTLAPDLPDWVAALGLKPMYLGLDLRGGIHVLIDVDMETAFNKAIDRYASDVRSFLQQKKLRYLGVSRDVDGITVKYANAALRDEAADKLGNEFRDLEIASSDTEGTYLIRLTMSKAKQLAERKFALEKNITTLRNRVNSMGVAEPIIQQQGERRIVVQLPGAQDPSKIKDILGATATLEYRLVDTEHSVEAALAGKVPATSRLYHERNGAPVLLKKRVIVTGNQVTGASSGFDSRSGDPVVTVNLDGQGAKRMRDVTTDNVGKPMAVVYIETLINTIEVDGKLVKSKKTVEEVISIAKILEPFGSRFQTTGLDSPAEAHDLALLLRAGALAAPIEIVEERTIGPNLGKDNITQGFYSVVIGLAGVMLFMAVYYRAFGLIANVALMVNLVLIVALLSLLQATLTLPGIAGIVLTVGMAVDANVLIFERIREELRIGNSPQASIMAGYEKAFSTIVDANVTTLIAAVVLFGFGTGPIKGFAVTLFIGIITSMFTAILGTRAIVNLLYGRKRLERVSI